MFIQLPGVICRLELK